MAYLLVAAFRVRTELPGTDIDWVEAAHPGFILSALETTSAWINGRLFKRYVVPFAEPVPSIVLGWLTTIVTASVWRKRAGVPSGDVSVSYLKETETARAEIKEAADSVEGLFDLPLRQDLTGGSGVTRGGPIGYSEASPYSSADEQARRIDRDGR